MNRLFCMTLTMIGLLVSGLTLAGQSESSCWYLAADGFSEHEECLERHGKDSLRIKPSHLRRLHFNDGYAAVFDKEHGWMVVNGRGEVVVQGVMRMDNGVDDIRDGFVRFEQEGKCGYASLRGSGGISARFDGCMPFEDGKARVCNGCRSESDGEYHRYTGGEWFCIDIRGERVACSP